MFRRRRYSLGSANDRLLPRTRRATPLTRITGGAHPRLHALRNMRLALSTSSVNASIRRDSHTPHHVRAETLRVWVSAGAYGLGCRRTSYHRHWRGSSGSGVTTGRRGGGCGLWPRCNAGPGATGLWLSPHVPVLRIEDTQPATCVQLASNWPRNLESSSDPIALVTLQTVLHDIAPRRALLTSTCRCAATSW